MAGVGVFCDTADAVVALSGGTAKTVLQIVAPSNQALMLKGLQCTFDGTSSTATPGLIQLVRQSTAGTMSSATPKKCPRADEGETLQSTAQYNATVEPTAGDVDRMWHVHPQLGFIYEFPFGDYYKIGGGTRVGIKPNFAAAVNVMASTWWDE